MAWAILDTSVYIDHWEAGLHVDAFEEIRRGFIVRHSSVVLFELRRGARRRDAERLVNQLFKLARVQWAPTTADWWEAGRIVRKIADGKTWDVRKRSEFQNDALIALTARRHGAAVVTTNRDDYEPLAEELRLPVVFL